VTGKEHEHAPVGGEREVGHDLRQRRVVAGLVIPRCGQIGGDPEQTLGRIVERRGKDFPHGYRAGLPVEPEPGFQELEFAAGRQRGAGEDHGGEPLHRVRVAARQVERHRR